MSKFTGNIIRLPAVTPTQNSASGVYTLDDQFTAQSSGTWPIVRDQYFNYTTLLLTGAVQGTAYPNPVTQPYSFLSDASTNNFVVSPNGDVSARPFNPYLNNYSNYFDGSTAYLTAAANSAINDFGTGDFNIELWFYATSSNFAVEPSLLSCVVAWATSVGYQFEIRSGGVVYFFAGDSVPININSGATTVSVNTWNHVAASRSSGTTRLFVNGTQVSSTNTVATISKSSTAVTIGAFSTAAQKFTGYLSNVRIVKGQALYTGNFTPPTAALTTTSVGTSGANVATSVTGTVGLLTCQSNRFRDAGPSNLTLTINGSPAVSQNSPFVSYDMTNGSGYFDGNGDWLSVGSSSAFGFGSSLNDFTVQGWFYIPAAITGNARGIFHVATSISSVVTGYGVGITNTQVLQYYAGGTFNNSTTTVTPGQWYYLTMVRSAGTVSVYLNGSLIQNGSIADSQNLTTAEATVGVWFEKSSSFGIPGYISDFRIVKGSALSATIPTAPLTPVSGTSLLTLQTRAPATNNGFIDSSPNNFVVTRNGNTTQGSFSPFSPTGWGNYFPSSSTYLTVPTSADFNLGTGAFTFETWLYITSSGLDQGIFQGSSAGLIIKINTANKFVVRLYAVADLLTSTNTITLNTWTHLAVARSGTTLSMWINGSRTAGGTVTDSSNFGQTGFVIASNETFTAQYFGYISNLRLVKGTAVYDPTQTSITVPTAPLSVIANTSILTCQSNRFLDQTGKTLTIVGSPSVQAFSPFAPAQSYIPSQIGGSGYFDGTGDYLSIASDPRLSWGTGDYTVEAWIYLTTAQSRIMITSGVGNFAFLTNSSRQLIVGRVGTDELIASELVPLNCWVHIAATRASNTTRIFINGISVATPTSITTNYGQNTTLIGGDPSNNLVGYMSGFRAVKGTALYTSNFIPPTTPLTPVTGTSLLLNFTNGGIVDATGKNNLETVANSGVQTSIINPFGSRTGLMYFNGSSYFYEPYTQLMNQLSGSFTIECWIYPTATSTRMIFAGSMSAAGSENWSWEITSANKLSYTFSIGGSSVTATSTASISQNTWTYVAVVRSGGTLTQYINGSSDGTASPTAGAYRNASFGFAIGRGGDYNSLYFTGYVDEFRMTIGQARTITASPTGPFPLG